MASDPRAVATPRARMAPGPPREVRSRPPTTGASGIVDHEVNCIVEVTRPWSSAVVVATR